MTSNTPDPLDELLSNWAEHQKADAQHAQVLADQILAALRDDVVEEDSKVVLSERSTAVSSSRSPPAYQNDWGAKLLLSGTLALMMLIACGALLLYNYTRYPNSLSISPTPAAASLSPALVQAKQRLLDETNAIFENQLAWIADGERDVSLDILDPEYSHSDGFMLVRVVVAQRAELESNWSTVWRTDLITRGDELVELSPEKLDGSSLVLWTHQVSGSEIAIEMDLRLNRQAQLQSSANTVVRVGEPTQVFYSNNGGVERCVFQTIVPLKSSRV